MVRGLKLVSLFLGYASLGVGGDYVVGLLAQDRGPRHAVGEIHRVEQAHVDARVSHSGRCAYGVERRVTLAASVADLLRLRAGSGELSVQGREDATQVVAVGMACASEETMLEDLTLTLERVGDDVVLSAHYPDRSWGGNGYARIDLSVEVPMGMSVDLKDSSGSMAVSGTGALHIEDSSGSILVRDARGDVVIGDSSGEILLTGVGGDVSIKDGSGEVELREIGGSVRLWDGSGSISAIGIGGSVVVEGDGSGSIEVRDVGGDFSVRADGSGSIRHSGVAGTVTIPEHKQRSRSR